MQFKTQADDPSHCCLFSTVPTDLISYLFGFLPNPDTKSTLYPTNFLTQRDLLVRSFFNVRLVCKCWNEAAKRCNSKWAFLLHTFGPLILSPTAIHSEYYTRHSDKCNVANGKCTIAKHYKNSQYIPKFALNEPKAFKKVMMFYGKRVENMLRVKKRQRERKEAVVKRRIESAQHSLSVLQKERLTVSESLQRHQEKYQTFMASQKKPSKSKKSKKSEQLEDDSNRPTKREKK